MIFAYLNPENLSTYSPIKLQLYNVCLDQNRLFNPIMHLNSPKPHVRTHSTSLKSYQEQFRSIAILRQLLPSAPLLFCDTAARFTAPYCYSTDFFQKALSLVVREHCMRWKHEWTLAFQNNLLLALVSLKFSDQLH